MQSVALDRGWRVVIRFAFAGFALGVLTALTLLLKAPDIFMLLIPLCPAVWIIPHFDWTASPAWFSFTYIPIVNSAPYAVLGALFAGLTDKTK